ncbi:O-antigen ligase [Clostridium puniceum]|uniref:O-antigen ligase n=1 Tax=Clostridium puniceum TaxID=29367 RepID=A0A1S8T9N1_9CLOT|nr:O-antigen ligase family protein [Clostridium puniceum]OOM74339.1 O-antigen ligase [Clostridium puniceum]
MKEIIKNIYKYVDNKFYFKLLYLFVSFTFVTMLQYIPGISILKNIVLAWAIILILLMIVEDYKRRKIYKFDIPLGLFMIITLILNIAAYRNSENIKIWLVNLILFLVIFSVEVFRDKKTLVKEMNIITYCYAIFMFIASIISLTMRFLGKTIVINEIIYGDTRGVFDNKNALGIAVAIAIVMCIYLNYIEKNHKLKMFWLGNIILQTITMIGSQGRSAYLVVIAVVYTFIFIYNKNKYIRATLLILPILVSAVILESGKINLERFTTERNNIWDSAIVVIKSHLFTGVGNSELVEAIKNARIGWYVPGIQYGGTHNIYVQIATVNGIISLLLFLMFLGIILMFIVHHLDKLQRKEKLQMTTLTSVIVGILAVNLFESTLVYMASFISLVFWIYLGYLISILDNKNIH